MPLKKKQLMELEELWGDPSALENALVNAIPADEQKRISALVLKRFEERTPPPGARTSARAWGESYGLAVRDALLRWTASQVRRFKKEIYELVCVDLAYCQKRDSDGLDLAVAVADSLVSIASQMPLPVTAVSVYLIKKRVLDKWCDC